MRRRSAAFVLVLLLAAGSATAAQRLVLHYDVYYLLLAVLSVDVASDTAAATYRTHVALRTAGLFATLAP